MAGPDRAATIARVSTLPTTLDGWLARCEQLHPRTIDLTLDRVQAVAGRLAIDFGTAAVITVAGTNGKGSTCAMLESIARAAGYRVGLYIKPHLVHFEERCRIDGEPAPAASLLPHFEAVEAARGDVTLTYFEFTTLAIARALAHARLDLVILEVGLGGRFDAVNAFDADCAVITSIALDHVEYLGPDRESIGAEKAPVMRAGRPAVVSDPQPPESILAHAQAVGADLWLLGRDYRFGGDRQQWWWQGRGQRHAGLAYPALRGANQLQNAAGALAALAALRDRLPVPAQAIRTGLRTVELAGRFQVLAGQPAVVLDVAHNPQSVGALALNLDAMGFYPRTLAVFGAMHDKALGEMFDRIGALVDEWHFCDLPTPRAATAAQLAQAWRDRSVASPGRPPAPVHLHADPAAALREAISRAQPEDRIVVFGSFYTVGGVLAAGDPGRSGAHAPKPAAPA